MILMYFFFRACLPIAVLEHPLLAAKAPFPIAVLWDPVMLAIKAPNPIAVL